MNKNNNNIQSDLQQGRPVTYTHVTKQYLGPVWILSRYHSGYATRVSC